MLATRLGGTFVTTALHGLEVRVGGILWLSMCGAERCWEQAACANGTDVGEYAQVAVGIVTRYGVGEMRGKGTTRPCSVVRDACHGCGLTEVGRERRLGPTELWHYDKDAIGPA